jgi:phosphoribosylformylglycinamidine (FGAM) synthase-like enzyme
MPKYKIVASKSQKKYTMIVSADSENEAKEKVHKENYSILTVAEYQDENIIEGKKFIFQVEMNGDIKNGIILGEDIFKVYVKLKDEL